MSDPVGFLTEKLAKIEALASGAESLAKSPWRPDGGRIEHSGGDVDRDREKFLWDSESCTEDWQPLCMRHGVAQFVAGMDPARVLRLVAATREVLGLHGPYGITCDICVLEFVRYDGPDMEPYPCPTVRELAKGWGWTDE